MGVCVLLNPGNFRHAKYKGDWERCLVRTDILNTAIRLFLQEDWGILRRTERIASPIAKRVEVYSTKKLVRRLLHQQVHQPGINNGEHLGTPHRVIRLTKADYAATSNNREHKPHN